jgi:hypothetical protein
MNVAARLKRKLSVGFIGFQKCENKFQGSSSRRNSLGLMIVNNICEYIRPPSIPAPGEIRFEDSAKLVKTVCPEIQASDLA